MKGARHLSREEIQGLAQSFYGEYETRNRTLFLLGLNIGTRISELLALNVGDDRWSGLLGQETGIHKWEVALD